jgi:hypothetical protein
VVSPTKGWTRIFQGSRLEADLVVAVLEASGLHPTSLGGIGEYAAVDYYDSQVLVPDGEAESARKVLETDLKSSPEGR